MRIRFAAAFVVLFAGIPLLAQDPLPPVTPKLIPEPQVVLAAEPEAVPVPAPTLAGAARANDFAAFDALFRSARTEAYRPLHELWTYSMTNPIGAFYGEDMYERFARAYPRFAEYIADHRIVDSRGNVFYPSSETRAFLLAQAENGAVPSRATAVGPTRTAVASDAPRARRSTRSKSKPPAIVAAKVPAAPLAPAPEPVSVVPAPLAAVVPAPPPVVVAQGPVRAIPEQKGSASGRGLLLLIIGLIGTGVLALIVRTPPEVPSIRNP